MIKTCSENFSSRRINIGMDEAEMLGRGKYLNKNGYTEPSVIMAEHLKKVLEICSKYGMHAMMWSDMFFKMLPNNLDYNVNAEIPKEIKDKVPEDVGLIYWDYYSRDKKIYDNMIMHHKKLSNRIGFAGGAWKWQGFYRLLPEKIMNKYIFNSLAKLAHVLEIKCDLGIRLKAAYDKRDLEELKKIAYMDCPELIKRIDEFHKAFRIQWHLENKPFGFDVQDLRIGGLKERISAVSWRIDSFLNKDINQIEELEQERLSLDGNNAPGYQALPYWQNYWKGMVSASVL